MLIDYFNLQNPMNIIHFIISSLTGVIIISFQIHVHQNYLGNYIILLYDLIHLIELILSNDSIIEGGVFASYKSLKSPDVNRLQHKPFTDYQ